MSGDSVTTHPVIDAEHVSHFYDGSDRRFPAIHDVTFRIARNEFVCLVGPSGCGKSTLLRIIAGLLSPSQGHITLAGQRIRGPGLDRGVVFQEPALFPWLRVRQNVEFGLRSSGWGAARARARALEVLAAVGLEESAERYPYQLSGGMQHRVAVARGWALTETQVLLMDEPFSAVDAITRAQLQAHLVRTWEAEPRAVVYVTHDIEEAVYLAQRVIVLTPSPARIAEVVALPLGYPRDRTSAEFTEARDRVTAALRNAMSGDPTSTTGEAR